MSASDAAPLPRLGEVFFDVRGSSRSMRLSWYSDTGVAVFSIWQGGTCTGTFRLPIDDLPRMVEALQRGPRGAAPPLTEVGGAPGERPRRAIPGGGTDAAMLPVENYPDYATGQNISLSPATGEFRAPGPEDYGDAPYGGDPLGSGSYRQQPYPDRGQAPEPAFPPSYPDDGPAYRDSGPPAGPPPGYRDDPLGSGGYRDEPPSYPGSEAPYGGDPLGSGSYRQQQPPAYREDPYPPYRDEPPLAYPNESRGQRYSDDPFQSPYPDDSRNGYGDDPRAGSHPYARDRDRDGREQRTPRGRS